MFKRLYLWTIALAKHDKAIYWLGFIGFIESIIFPIPADLMLAPMCLARPERAYRYALVLSVSSVLGGILGYALGYYFSDFAQSLIASMGKAQAFVHFREIFNQFGIPFVFIAGFSPFPYKIVTIGAGLIPISFTLFFLGSVISRPLRFFLLAFALKKGGKKLEKTLLKYIEWLGWISLILVASVIAYLYIKR